MNWRLTGQDHTLLFLFRVDGQFAVPDDGSIKLTVRGSDGVALTGYNQEPQTDPLSTQMSITLPSSINTLTGVLDFEMRYARLEFTIDGKPFHVEQNYRIHNFIPLNYTADNVRAIVGAEYNELPDEDIDLLDSYFHLVSRADLSAPLKSALVSSSILNLHANDAVVAYAALRIFPSLQSRLLKEEKQDNAGYTRQVIDFEELKLRLDLKLQEAIAAVIAGASGVATSAQTANIFLLVTPTDSLTGA